MPPPPTRGRQHRGDGCNRTPNTVAQAMSHVPPSPSGTIFSVFYAIPTVSLDVISGSDIHVMLALCCRSRQVVMANEELNGTDMVGELLGKRQRCAYQTRNALSQRVVEPFDVIGFAG
jgi:hypothetical protein